MPPLNCRPRGTLVATFGSDRAIRSDLIDRIIQPEVSKRLHIGGTPFIQISTTRQGPMGGAPSGKPAHRGLEAGGQYRTEPRCGKPRESESKHGERANAEAVARFRLSVSVASRSGNGGFATTVRSRRRFCEECQSRGSSRHLMKCSRNASTFGSVATNYMELATCKV